MSSIKSELLGAGIGAAGAVGMDIIWGYVTPYLPASLTSSPYVTYALKIAGAIGIGALAGKFAGRDKARAATLGAVTVVAYDALRALVQSSAPSIPMAGLGAYMHAQPMSGFGAYNPASYLRSSGNTAVPGIANNPVQFGAYMPQQMAGVMGDEMF